jgi:hypothetical protein
MGIVALGDLITSLDKSRVKEVLETFEAYDLILKIDSLGLNIVHERLCAIKLNAMLLTIIKRHCGDAAPIDTCIVQAAKKKGRRIHATRKRYYVIHIFTLD